MALQTSCLAPCWPSFFRSVIWAGDADTAACCSFFFPLILFVLHQQWTCAFHCSKKSLNISLLHVLLITAVFLLRRCNINWWLILRNLIGIIHTHTRCVFYRRCTIKFSPLKFPGCGNKKSNLSFRKCVCVCVLYVIIHCCVLFEAESLYLSTHWAEDSMTRSGNSSLCPVLPCC